LSDTPLARKIKRLIEANGPMSIADYMAQCLSDPEHGYYTTGDPFGARGDFITAPEVSQMFGEIVGAWLCEAWRLSKSPSSVRLVELGPGRGTLMADILRVTAKAPNFADAISVHLIEISPALKSRQAETLGRFEYDLAWHSSFADVPDGPLFLVANEFFDALPIRQYVRAEEAWRERVVGLGSDGELTFGIGIGRLDDIAARLAPPVPPPSSTGEEQTIVEIRPGADALMTEVTSRIVSFGGAALVIDYGYDATRFGDTLQAVRAHHYADPLGSPGEADLTAHVDFSALAKSARSAGASVHGPMNQGDFLVSLGLLERAGRLGANADESAREALRVAVERLASPEQMGTLFKVLAIARPGIVPPGFAAMR
jgi:SAM-dependent MidA family methyltransferase